ncbi:MAG: hypothetical protein ABI232_08135 [Jatrophihabitantaceae bacterium]
MSSIAALDSDQIGKIGIGAIVAFVVIGALLSMVITAIVGRIVILVVVVALGVLVWQQRTNIQDHVKDCNLKMTFVGIHIDAPQSVQQRCQNIQKK